MQGIHDAGAHLLALVTELLDPGRLERAGNWDLDDLTGQARATLREPVEALVALCGSLVADAGAPGPDAFMPLQRPSVALEHPCLLLQYLR